MGKRRYSKPHLATMTDTSNGHLPAQHLVSNLSIVLVQFVKLSHLLDRAASVGTNLLNRRHRCDAHGDG